MSKYIKGLIVDDVARKLHGVSDALVCNAIGLDSGNTMQLRKELRAKGIHLLVVKRSLARRAVENSPQANLPQPHRDIRFEYVHLAASLATVVAVNAAK